MTRQERSCVRQIDEADRPFVKLSKVGPARGVSQYHLIEPIWKNHQARPISLQMAGDLRATTGREKAVALFGVGPNGRSPGRLVNRSFIPAPRNVLRDHGHPTVRRATLTQRALPQNGPPPANPPAICP